ncbi:MAG: hypothetical protein KatS3mg016_1149 [Fimbriimonadales bacterium]|nr:MAG: hypothetical protein KatS3mg016_1149 [Fimbriimonadales bacterium]
MTMTQTRISSQDRQTPLERRLAVRMRHAPIGQCLTFEQFMELARRGRRAPEYHTHMLHVVSCSACRRAYLNLRALLHLQRPSMARWLKRFSLPSMPQWALASGVAASVFALALWTFYPKSNNPNMAATRPNNPSRVEVAQNTPADTNAKSQSKGNLTGTPDSVSNQAEPSDTGGIAGTRNHPSSPLADGEPSGLKRAQTPSTPRKQVAPPSTPGKASGASAGGAQRPPKETAPDRQGDGETVLAQTPPNTPNELAPSKEPSEPANSAPNTLTLEQRIARASGLFRTPVSKLSEALASLTSNSARRGGNNTPSTGQVKFIEPDLSESRLLEEAQPLFKWEPVNNATQYVITLRAQSGNLALVDELSPEQTEYRPSTPLERGKSYTLTLEVVREGLSTLRGTLRFEVMSADDLHDLSVARANRHKHPELSGIVFYRLQRYRDALEAFEIAQQRNPKDPEIQHIVKRLRALIR